MSMRLLVSLMVLVALALPVAAAAATMVAQYGVDTPSCGSAGAPCATIQHAVDITPAGGIVQVGPGTYGGFTVDHRLTVVSSLGAAATLIDDVIGITEDGVTLGKSGRGFTIVPGPPGPCLSSASSGLRIAGNVAARCGPGFLFSGNDVQLRGNQVSFPNGDGVQISGAGALVQDNVVTNAEVGFNFFPTSSGAVVRGNVVESPSARGFLVTGGGHLLEENTVVRGHDDAFFVSSPTLPGTLRKNTAVATNPGGGFFIFNASGWKIQGNAAIGSTGEGFELSGCTSCHVDGNTAVGGASVGYRISNWASGTLTGNAALGNVGGGFVIEGSSTGVKIQKGNIAGNGGNCGITNNISPASPVDATHNFWGQASGPGPDPADDVCPGTGAVTTTPFATKPFIVTVPAPF